MNLLLHSTRKRSFCCCCLKAAKLQQLDSLLLCHLHKRVITKRAHAPIDPNRCGETQHNLQHPAPTSWVLNSVGKTRFIWSLLNFTAAARQNKEVWLKGASVCKQTSASGQSLRLGEQKKKNQLRVSTSRAAYHLQAPEGSEMQNLPTPPPNPPPVSLT